MEKVIKVLSKKQQLLARDGYVCYICKLSFEIDNLTTDHIVPKSMNGSTSLSNQRLLCLKCHKEKNMIESKAKRLLGRALFIHDPTAKKALFDLIDNVITESKHVMVITN